MGLVTIDKKQLKKIREDLDILSGVFENDGIYNGLSFFEKKKVKSQKKQLKKRINYLDSILH